MKKAMLLTTEANRDLCFGEEHIGALRKLVELTDCCHLIGNLEALRPRLQQTEIICSSWGLMRLDEEFLAAAPRLKAVFYAAGSVRGFVTEAFWDRGILLTNGAAALAVSVAEFTVALITLASKGAFDCNRATRQSRTFARVQPIKGMYQTRIGIIGVGQVGRRVIGLLRSYEVELFCYDPFLGPEQARQLGARPIPLEEMFRTCDVVTLHAPNTASTEHMITGEHFRSMKDGAVFINTARGRIVREDELIEELRRGRIFACLDVTDPEPPPPDSPLYTLPNVFLTPHLSGSAGQECRRMGAYVVEEVRRYCAGLPPAFPVTRAMMQWMA